MAWIAPCKHCERAGCGAYHDQCPEYQEYLGRKGNYNERLKIVKAVDAVHDVRRDWKFKSEEHPGLQRKDYTRKKFNES